MIGPKLSSTLASLSTVVAGGLAVCTGASDVRARQFMSARSAGDPGDGSEAELDCGGHGDPTGGEVGDPTDGNGWPYPEVRATTAGPCHVEICERDKRVDT